MRRYQGTACFPERATVENFGDGAEIQHARRVRSPEESYRGSGFSKFARA
jgi:hypothetical protein